MSFVEAGENILTLRELARISQNLVNLNTPAPTSSSTVFTTPLLPLTPTALDLVQSPAQPLPRIGTLHGISNIHTTPPRR